MILYMNISYMMTVVLPHNVQAHSTNPYCIMVLYNKCGLLLTLASHLGMTSSFRTG